MPRIVDPSGSNKRLVACSWGMEKSGKTDFALTFPRPIHFFNTNYGIDPLLNGPRYRHIANEVLIYDYGIANPGDYDETKATLERFHTEYLAACEKVGAEGGTGGTIVVDTAAELWEIVRVVKLQEVRAERFRKQSKAATVEDLKNMRTDYGPVNLYMRGLMQRVLHFPNGNALFINNCKSKYNEAGQETAEKIYSGFGALTAITDVTLRHFKDIKSGKFYAAVDRCRHNTEIEGQPYEDPTYQVIMAYVFG